MTAPLRSHAPEMPDSKLRAGTPEQERAGTLHDDEITRAELEAAREAKYREIRDSELDFRTGKLSSEDYAAIDGQLRAEALAILDRLEALDPDSAKSGSPRAGARPPARPPAQPGS